MRDMTMPEIPRQERASVRRSVYIDPTKGIVPPLPEIALPPPFPTDLAIDEEIQQVVDAPKPEVVWDDATITTQFTGTTNGVFDI